MFTVHLLLIVKVLLHDPSVMIDLSFNLGVRSVVTIIEFLSLLCGNDKVLSGIPLYLSSRQYWVILTDRLL